MRAIVAVTIALAALAGLGSCGRSSDIEGYEELSRHVERNRVGAGTDQWIEMISLAGSSERVGLIFGYVDDYQACQEAIAGMRAANPGRDYICTPAN